jgi:hypothetical protein
MQSQDIFKNNTNSHPCQNLSEIISNIFNFYLTRHGGIHRLPVRATTGFFQKVKGSKSKKGIDFAIVETL